MPEVPEHLLRRSRERRKALGLPVEGDDGDDASTTEEAPAADAGAAEPVGEVPAAASDAGDEITESRGGVLARLRGLSGKRKAALAVVRAVALRAAAGPPRTGILFATPV